MITPKCARCGTAGLVKEYTIDAGGTISTGIIGAPGYAAWTLKYMSIKLGLCQPCKDVLINPPTDRYFLSLEI